MADIEEILYSFATACQECQGCRHIYDMPRMRQKLELIMQMLLKKHEDAEEFVTRMNEYINSSILIAHNNYCNLWLLKTIESYDVFQLFICTCCCGQLEFAKLQLEVNLEYILYDISNDNEETFRLVCENGHLKVAQWLLQVKPDININPLYGAYDRDNICYNFANPLLYAVCAKGNLEVLEWLLNINPNIETSFNFEIAFHLACERGHLEIAKWLYELKLKPLIDVSTLSDDEFYIVCEKQQSDLVQWLEQIKPSICISMLDSAFISSCVGWKSHSCVPTLSLALKEYLLGEQSQLMQCMIRELRVEFHELLAYGHPKVAKWIASLKPERYEILQILTRNDGTCSSVEYTVHTKNNRQVDYI